MVWDTTSHQSEGIVSKIQKLTRNPCALLVRMQTGAVTMQSSTEVPQKVKIRNTIWTTNPTSGNLSKDNKNH